MNEFKHVAPLAWNGSHLPSSGYGRLALALGQLTGGMLEDGATMGLDASDFGLIAAQIMLSEAGSDLLVAGVASDVDGAHTFVAMSNGEIWRFCSFVMAGNLITEAYKSGADECRDNCEQSGEMVESIKSIVIDQLNENGAVGDAESFYGHVEVDHWAAIMATPKGTGKFIVRDSSGQIKSGWKFMLDAPRNATIEEVASVLSFKQMSDEEIKAEQDDYLMAIGLDGSAFPTKVALA